MKQAALVSALIALLALAGTAAAGTKTVTATITGSCLEVDTLDSLGVLKYFTLTCNAGGACKCGGATRVTYTSVSVLKGTGASGREHGTLLATGPTGTATLNFKGTRTALGVSSGTWTLGKVTGYSGVKLTRHGTYTTSAKTTQTITGTKKTLVRITASYGCWNCAA